MQIYNDPYGKQILLLYVPYLASRRLGKDFDAYASQTISYNTAMCQYARCKILERFYDCNALSTIEDCIIFYMDYYDYVQKQTAELLEMLRAQSRDCRVMLDVVNLCLDRMLIWNELCKSVHMSVYTF
jgi:hypothetical protein